LGTVFRNGMCCLSGVFAYQDVFMNPEMQATKEFFKDDSHLPDGSIIPSHTQLKLCDKLTGRIYERIAPGWAVMHGSAVFVLRWRLKLGLVQGQPSLSRTAHIYSLCKHCMWS
jgi:hypothetical protein